MHIDLRHAYYTIPVYPERQKFLKFLFNNTLYQYICLPNGLSSAPCIVPQLLNPVLVTLHEQGCLNLSYINDFYLQGDTSSDCDDNVKATCILFRDLGFHLHDNKSILQSI